MTACSTAPSNPALPDVVVYSKNTQLKALTELRTNDVPTIREMMKDYKVMRDQTRAAKSYH